MTRRDYIALSQLLKYSRPTPQAGASAADKQTAQDTIDYVAGKIANYCASQNRSFDRARFLRECGLTQEVR